MAAGTTNSGRSRRWFSITHVVYGLITLVVVILFFFWATLFFGRVHGTEFSAESLARREFNYYRLPLLGFQVTSLDRTPVASATEQFLLSKKYVTPVLPEKWDLIRGYQGVSIVDPLGASILCAYFDAQDHQSQPFWISWSQDHPKLATILWPEVINVARLRHFEMIPDMMQLAQTADERQPQQFQSELNVLIADQAVRLAKWFQSIDANRARDLYKLALSKVPQHPAAQQGLQTLAQAND